LSQEDFACRSKYSRLTASSVAPPASRSKGAETIDDALETAASRPRKSRTEAVCRPIYDAVSLDDGTP
jgi:hypothetical protein